MPTKISSAPTRGFGSERDLFKLPENLHVKLDDWRLSDATAPKASKAWKVPERRFDAELQTPTPTPPSTPTTPAGPVPSYPNFQLIFDEYFTKDCAEGQTLTVYGDKFFFYPVGWDDTSNKGLYDTDIRHREHADAHPHGRPRVCAPEPKINGPSAARVVAVAEVGRLAS